MNTFPVAMCVEAISASNTLMFVSGVLGGLIISHVLNFIAASRWDDDDHRS